MKFDCPHCGQNIEAGDTLAGAAAECPTCGKGLVVPTARTVEIQQSNAGQAPHRGEVSPVSQQGLQHSGESLSEKDAALIVRSAISDFESARRKRRNQSLTVAAFCFGILFLIMFLSGVQLVNLVGAAGILLVIFVAGFVKEIRDVPWDDGRTREQLAQIIVVSYLGNPTRPLGQLIAIENEANHILGYLGEGELTGVRRSRKLVCDEFIKQIGWSKTALRREGAKGDQSGR